MTDVAQTTETTTTAPVSAAPATPPATFAEAVEPLREQAAAAAVASPEGTATTAPGAITQAQPPVEASKKGPIPFEVHETTLKNARAKERAEVEAGYAWAKDLASAPEAHRTNLLTWHRLLTSDPATAIGEVLQAFAGDPRSAPVLISHAARLLNQARGGGQAPAADPEPEPDFVLPVKDAQGTIIGERPIYSAEQQMKREAWKERQLMAKVAQQIAPLQQTADAVASERQVTAYTAITQGALDAIAKAHPEQFGTEDSANEYKAAIAAVIKGDQVLFDLAGDPKTAPLAIRYAWSEVHREKVLPSLAQTERATVLASLHQKGHAGSINPSHTNTSPPSVADGRFTPERVAAHFGAQG